MGVGGVDAPPVPPMTMVPTMTMTPLELISPSPTRPLSHMSDGQSGILNTLSSSPPYTGGNSSPLPTTSLKTLSMDNGYPHNNNNNTTYVGGNVTGTNNSSLTGMNQHSMIQNTMAQNAINPMNNNPTGNASSMINGVNGLANVNGMMNLGVIGRASSTSPRRGVGLSSGIPSPGWFY